MNAKEDTDKLKELWKNSPDFKYIVLRMGNVCMSELTKRELMEQLNATHTD